MDDLPVREDLCVLVCTEMSDGKISGASDKVGEAHVE